MKIIAAFDLHNAHDYNDAYLALSKLGLKPRDSDDDEYPATTVVGEMKVGTVKEAHELVVQTLKAATRRQCKVIVAEYSVFFFSPRWE